VGNPAGRRVSRDTARDGRSRRAHGARPVARICRATARHRGVVAKAFGHFALFKVARRKGVTRRSPLRLEWICTQLFSRYPVYISIGCATAIYGFRPYGEALLSNSHKSTQKGLAHSVRPSLRPRSVGTPPRAIHGPSRLSRHPCRDTHCAEPPLGLPKGRTDQKPKQQQQPNQKIAACGSLVAGRVVFDLALDLDVRGPLNPAGLR